MARLHKLFALGLFGDGAVFVWLSGMIWRFLENSTERCDYIFRGCLGDLRNYIGNILNILRELFIWIVRFSGYFCVSKMVGGF